MATYWCGEGQINIFKAVAGAGMGRKKSGATDEATRTLQDRMVNTLDELHKQMFFHAWTIDGETGGLIAPDPDKGGWAVSWPEGAVRPKKGATVKRNVINQYTCEICGKSITTIDRDEGVTSYFLACRATPNCDGKMHSHMYRVDQTLTPDFEWYRPKGKIPKIHRHHVEQGGLLIRKVGAR